MHIKYCIICNITVVMTMSTISSKLFSDFDVPDFYGSGGLY